MLKIRRPLGRLIFNMGIAIPGKTVFLIETAPWFFVRTATKKSNLRITELCEGSPADNGKYPSQRPSLSLPWCYQEYPELDRKKNCEVRESYKKMTNSVPFKLVVLNQHVCNDKDKNKIVLSVSRSPWHCWYIEKFTKRSHQSTFYPKNYFTGNRISKVFKWAG